MAIQNAYRLVVGVLFLTLPVVSSVVSAETLEEAWKTALAADQGLQAAQRHIQAARHELSAAKAERLPNVRVESGYTVLDNAPALSVDLPIPGLTLDEFPFAEDRSLAFHASASVPLFTGGRISRGIAAAGAGLQSAEANEVRRRLDLKLAVAKAYVAVLRTRRALEVAETNVLSLVAHASDVENLFNQGMVARNDLLAARVALADARQKALTARNRVDISFSAYNRLLGRPLTQRTMLEELPVRPEVREDVEALTREALGHRPELTVVKQRAWACKHRAAMARAATLPQIALAGHYLFDENKYLVHEEVWSATLGLRWDIFDKGISRHKSRSLLEQAQAQLNMREDLASRIAVEVRQPWLDLAETQKRIAVTRAALEQAAENLNVTKDRYRNGLGTNTEVLDAETLRTRSYSNYHNALYDCILAHFRLRHAVGDL